VSGDLRKWGVVSVGPFRFREPPMHDVVVVTRRIVRATRNGLCFTGRTLARDGAGPYRKLDSDEGRASQE
jgi:hypothetical protein